MNLHIRCYIFGLIMLQLLGVDGQTISHNSQNELYRNAFLIRYYFINAPEERFSDSNFISYEVLLPESKVEIRYLDSLYKSSRKRFGDTFIHDKKDIQRFDSILNTVRFYPFGYYNTGDSIPQEIWRPEKVPQSGCVIAERTFRGFDDFDSALVKGVYYNIDKVSFTGRVVLFSSFTEYVSASTYESRYPDEGIGFHHFDIYRAIIRNRQWRVSAGFEAMYIEELCYFGHRQKKSIHITLSSVINAGSI